MLMYTVHNVWLLSPPVAMALITEMINWNTVYSQKKDYFHRDSGSKEIKFMILNF